MRKLLLLGFFLLFASSALAVSCSNENPYAGTVSVAGEYASACAKFTWTISRPADHAAMDFNNYVVSIVGTGVSEDFNTRSNSHNACTVAGGDSVVISVKAYDGNKAGMVCSNDANTIVWSGISANAMRLLSYNIFSTFANLAGLIVLMSIAALFLLHLSRMN